MQHLGSILTGPYPFSVSKINQLVSIYILLMWIFLAWITLPKCVCSHPLIIWNYVAAVSLTLGALFAIAVLGRTDESDYSHVARIRGEAIKEPPNTPAKTDS